MEVFTIKKKALALFLFGFILSGSVSVYAADGEIYDLTTQNVKYTLDDLTSLKNQMEVGLHSSKYGYEYGSQVYNLNEVNKIYVTETKSGNKDLAKILGKVKSDCKAAFAPSSFSIKSIQYADEMFSSNLYVEVSNPEKVTGVTVDGVQLQLDDRYAIENGKVKITFKKGTSKDKLGKVIISGASKSYEITLGSDGNFVANELSVDDFTIKSVEYIDEMVSSNLYVQVSSPEKVTGVTVDGVSLQLNDRYVLEGDKVKITFTKGTPVDAIGKVTIVTASKSYDVTVQDTEEFDVEDIY
jgi:hypothetical protein